MPENIQGNENVFIKEADKESAVGNKNIAELKSRK